MRMFYFSALAWMALSTPAFALSPDTSEDAHAMLTEGMDVGGSTSSWASAPGAIGGFRQVTVEGGNSGTPGHEVTSEITGGSWLVTMDGSGNSEWVRLLWSDASGVSVFSSPIDLTAGGQSDFILSIASLNTGVEIAVYFLDTDSSDTVYKYPNAAGDVVWDYTEFTGIDFSQVNQITVTISSISSDSVSFAAAELTPVSLQAYSVE